MRKSLVVKNMLHTKKETNDNELRPTVTHPQPRAFGELRLHVTITSEFVNWLLFYGKRVKIMVPPELRARVAEEDRWLPVRAGQEKKMRMGFKACSNDARSSGPKNSLRRYYFVPLTDTGVLIRVHLFIPRSLSTLGIQPCTPFLLER